MQHKLKTRLSQKRGQAAVEFALVLPLLLLVVYGLIEAGRAIFIYSSVTNASREAVRYASAYGVNPDDVPRFQDCAGIRNAAARTGFYLALDDIQITYDKGVVPGANPGDPPDLNPIPTDGSFDTTCDGDTDTNIELECGDRIIVTIRETYSPILSIIPLKPKDITSSSARSFVGIVTYDLTNGATCGGTE